MTTRDDIVAALKRAAEVIDSLLYTEEAKIVRALADALREGQERGPAQFNPWGGEVSCVWIIPEPRIARRALSGEGE